MPQNNDPFDNYDDEDDGFLTFDARDDEGTMSRGPIILAAVVLLLAVFGAIAWVYFAGDKGKNDAPEQITADAGSFKEAPMDPGGAVTNDLDKGVYEGIEGESPPPLELEATTGAEDPLVAANVVAPPPVLPTATPKATVAPRPTPTVTAAVAPKPKPKPAPVVKAAPPKVVKSTVTPPRPTPAPTAPATQTTTKAEPKAASASPSTGGSYSAQLGSFPTRASAEQAAAGYRDRTPATVAVSSADLGSKGTWYRVRVTGLESRDVAVAFCAQVKASGGQCIPSR